VYAPRILADEGIDVVMKVSTSHVLKFEILRSSALCQSDHPAISRSLLHEAQQAHYHGLPDHLALSSVIGVPAKIAGLDWRLGFIKKGVLYLP
jgi:hypothetical protein